MTPDHPNLRRSMVCPFCRKAKERGLVVCWQCYRVHNIRNGGEPERVLLDLCEDELRGLNQTRMHYFATGEVAR